MMKARKQATKTKPKILNAKMKQGQNPELKSVVSGVGTTQREGVINYKNIILVLLEIGTLSPPVLKWNKL